MLRHERKYLVPYYLLDDLRERFSGFIRPDTFTEENMYGRYQYTVRSIYFDSHDLSNYHEKISGLMDRVKLRVRGYNELEPKEFVVLEVKKKKGNRILKHRTMVPYSQLAYVLQTGDVASCMALRKNQTTEQALDESGRFFFHYKKRNQQPTVLVTYEREAFHGLLNPGIRITFDKNIRSKIYPDLSELYAENDMRLIFKNHFILEIKYFEDNMPGWIKPVIYEFKLRTDALSKYALGYEVHKNYISI